MSVVKATGILYHQFHGDYRAVIGLDCGDELSAGDVLRSLGADWKIGTEHKKVLVWSGDRDQLEVLKSALKQRYNLQVLPCGYRFCRDQCQDAEIDNCNHSIDYGAKFSVEINVIPEEQASLF